MRYTNTIRFLFSIISFSFFFFLLPPSHAYAAAPTATISSPATTVAVGSSLTFTAHAQGTNMQNVEVYKARVGSNLVDPAAGSWTRIGLIPCTADTCAGTTSWTPTVADVGDWHVVVNAHDDWNPTDGNNDPNGNIDPNENCTGNPDYITPDWTDCSINGGVDSLIITVPPLPTATPNPQVTDTPPQIIDAGCDAISCFAKAKDPDFYKSDAPEAFKEVRSFSWIFDGVPYHEDASLATNALSSSLATRVLGTSTDEETAYQSVPYPTNACIVSVVVEDESGEASLPHIVDSTLCARLLPARSDPFPPDWNTIKQNVVSQVLGNASNVNVYKQAEAATGIPWALLAGIHNKEGQSNPNKSLVSGRIIGTAEPDVHVCDAFGPGVPIHVPGGCGFASLLDSAIYAGNHLKEGLGGRPPQSYEEIVSILSQYNGGGNRNCSVPTDPISLKPRTLYDNPTHCPHLFDGEDDLYPLNKIDAKHSPMYRVYCSDGNICPPPQRTIYDSYGVLTVVRALITHFWDQILP